VNNSYYKHESHFVLVEKSRLGRAKRRIWKCWYYNRCTLYTVYFYACRKNQIC